MNRKLWLLMTWLLVVPAFVQAASVRGVVVDYETYCECKSCDTERVGCYGF
jgi:hypothetical protein